MPCADELRGRRLLRVTGSWHHCPGIEPTLLHLWLHMEGLGPVRLHTAGSGSLELRIDQPYGAYSMDELGHVTVEGAGQGLPLSPFVGRSVLSIGEVRDLSIDRVIGIVLRFDAGSIRILNLGDELVLTRDEHPGCST